MEKSAILAEFLAKKDRIEVLGKKVNEIMKEMIQSEHFFICDMAYRVKAKDSLSEKLNRKKDEIHCFSDITDLLGFRIITFFSDDVDKVGEAICDRFTIDWENSVDKRKSLDPREFGYLSLHYICSLKPEDDVDGNLSEFKFEVQIRTVLQHAWAEIEHDLGYKSMFGVPAATRRNFSRVASLLEVADSEFLRLRDSSRAYANEVKEKIAYGNADDVFVDSVSMDEFMRSNSQMRAYYEEISEKLNIEIFPASTERYLEQIEWLGIHTIGEFLKIFEKNRTLVTCIIEDKVKKPDIDIASSSVVIRSVCLAHLLKNHYSEEQLKRYFSIFMSDEGAIAKEVNWVTEWSNKWGYK